MQKGILPGSISFGFLGEGVFHAERHALTGFPGFSLRSIVYRAHLTPPDPRLPHHHADCCKLFPRHRHAQGGSGTWHEPRSRGTNVTITTRNDACGPELTIVCRFSCTLSSPTEMSWVVR